MKTFSIAAVLCVSLGFAGAASAKMDEKLCRAGQAAAKDARSCTGTPYAQAYIDTRTAICAIEYPESKAMGDLNKSPTHDAKFLTDTLTRALNHLDQACKQGKAAKK
jgi:hypothetical protein